MFVQEDCLTATTPLQQTLSDLHSSFPTPYFDEYEAMALAPTPVSEIITSSPCDGRTNVSSDGCSPLVVTPASADDPSLGLPLSPTTSDTIPAPLDSNPQLDAWDVSAATANELGTLSVGITFTHPVLPKLVVVILVINCVIDAMLE